MAVSALIKMLAFLLVGLAAAAPTVSGTSALALGFESSSGTPCTQNFCWPVFEECLRAHFQDDGHCREYVCGVYADECGKCGGCQGPDTVGLSARQSTDKAPEHCYYVCTADTCSRMCSTPDSISPTSLAGALVMKEPTTPHAIAIQIADTSAAAKWCWICTLGGCFRVKCNGRGKGQAATQAVAGTNDHGHCKKVCPAGEPDTVCIMVCDPDWYEPDTQHAAVARATDEEDCEKVCSDDVMCVQMCAVARDCEKVCSGDVMCVQMCANASANAVQKEKRNDQACWEQCDRDHCWVVCNPPSATQKQKREEDCEKVCSGDVICVQMCANASAVQKQKRDNQACWELCDADHCWPVCDPPRHGAEEQKRDAQSQSCVRWELQCDGKRCRPVCTRLHWGTAMQKRDGAQEGNIEVCLLKMCWKIYGLDGSVEGTNGA